MTTICMVKGALVLSEVRGLTGETVITGMWSRVVPFRFLDAVSGLLPAANDRTARPVALVPLGRTD